MVKSDVQTGTGWNPEFVNAIQQPIWTTHPDGTVDYANSFWHAYTDLEEDISLGSGCTAAVHPDDVAAVQGQWRMAADTLERYEIEFRLRRADGVYRWHLARVAPIAVRNGEKSRWVASAIDIDDRRRTEEALREIESRYRDVIDHADDIFYTLAMDGTVMAVNAAVERVLGYRPDELIGQSIDAVIVPDQVDVSHSMLDLKLHGADRSTYELDVVARDGRRVALDINTRLVTAHNRPTVIHGIARDISARRERSRQVELSAAVGTALIAQRPLAEQLDQCMQAVVDHLDAAFARVWTVDEADPDVLMLRASAGMYTHLDGHHGRIRIGEYKIGRIASERRPHVSNTVATDPEVSDKEWARREGMVSFAGYPLIVGERLLGVMGLFARHPLDRTTLSILSSIVNAISVGIDRDRAERAQRSILERETAARRWAQATEIRYRELFEGVADAIIVTDANRLFQDANTAAIALLGYERDELLRFRVEDIVASDTDTTRTEFSRFSNDGIWQGELKLRRKDGSVVPVEARAAIVDLPDGQVFLSTIRDITERNHLERLQRDFMAMVTHDLRTPLTSIKGWSQMLRRRHEDARTQRTITYMLTQVDRMERLINDLADLVREGEGELRLRRGPVDLVELAHHQAALTQEQAGRHQVRVETGIPNVMGTWDRQRIEQIFQNLLTNALKYSPDGGDVIVRVDVVDDEARLMVIDQGVGISPDSVPLLFKRFYRADATGAGGLGLGLHISEMLVRAHGGRIWASSNLGEGSTFTVALPFGGQDEA
jgi:PAS domain S-box-containing protein